MHDETDEPVTSPSGDGDGLVRVRLDVQYDGTAFAGWAAQRGGLRTVEGELAAALPVVFRTEAVSKLVVAGRTDAGVHAGGQVCHVDVPRKAWDAVPGRSSLTPEESLVRRLAGMLARDVRVQRASLAPAGFDARFAALWRRYAYRVSDDAGGVPPLRRLDVLAAGRPLDVEAMDDAAGRLVGLHDFAAFCKRREGATTVRTLLEYGWSREEGTGLAVARVRADAFCHSMVRALVGATLTVGEGRRPVEWPAQVLGRAARDGAVHVVAPHGLTLEEVRYPGPEGLAARVLEARNRRG